ncbi:E3 ubiquitin-protein ligase UBR1-like protein [Babesia gibsoni]|uniref:E3 ubiquitin-protein ligase n=1 Tax=Babesia gibsoni TaxID=33632 RepID=A0AAD8PD84_BABGI|nr:E3 ubiquitin-protein ligase UBR1-like protein [Babesia gibsoni]
MEEDPRLLSPTMEMAGETLDLQHIKDAYGNTRERERLFDELYCYLYAGVNRNKIHQLIELHSDLTGLCTAKWLEETVAVKCYECEADSTCAICLECYFRSNHEGHKCRLTRTSGGCCDCGDNSAWNPKGSCSKHSTPITLEAEKALLQLFHGDFIARLNDLLQKITKEITEYIQRLDLMGENFVYMLLLFLGELLKVTPAYRLAMGATIERKTLLLWVKNHHLLSVESRKAFNSLYLTMITSMSFRSLFAEVYVELYRHIMHPYRDTADEWQLTDLSVQIFTYSFVAVKAVEQGFLEDGLYPVIEQNYTDTRKDTIVFKRLDSRLFESILRVMSDLTYILNHPAVVELVITSPQPRMSIFKLLKKMHMMNIIVRATGQHVLYENTGFIVAYASEHALQMAIRPITEAARSDVKRSSGLYIAMNAYIRENLCSWSYDSTRLCRSFHVPFIRFFVSVICTDHLAKLHSPDTTIDELKNDPIVSAFDDEVLIWVLKQAISIIRFHMEIRNKYWLYNGESMQDQADQYTKETFIQMDVCAMQVVAIIVGLRRRAGLSKVELLPIIYKEAFASHMKPTKSSEFKEVEIPGDLQFKMVFFVHIIMLIVNDIRSMGMLSMADKTTQKYVQRAYPMILLDIVLALSVGMIEFKEIMNSVNAIWRRHPKVLQALEEVATLTYSPVADKTYVRAKGEAFALLDVLWNPHVNIADFTISSDVLKRGYSMLGQPRSAKFVQSEYYQMQDAVVHGLGVEELFDVTLRYIKVLAYNQQGGDPEAKDVDHSTASPRDGEKFYDAAGESDSFEDAVSGHMQYFNTEISLPGSLDSKWNQSILWVIKTINLFMETTKVIDSTNARDIVNALETLVQRIGEEPIVKAAIEYTVKRIREAFHVEKGQTEDERLEDSMKTIKTIQSKFMKKMIARQKKIKLDDLDDTVAPVFEEDDHQTCILCRERMDDKNPMGFMCLLSTNSVMRNCVQSIGGTGVYAVSSLPRTTSMISSCGHVAHTKCINDHREKHVGGNILMTNATDKSKNEYFCPICKALCNYTMDYVSESAMMMDRPTDPHNDMLSSICKAAWRYRFSVGWAPSPIHLRYDNNPHALYTFSALLPLNENTPLPNAGRSILDDLGNNNSQNIVMKCLTCTHETIVDDYFYKPKCKALFTPKNIEATHVDREHLAMQLCHRVKGNPEVLEGLKKLLDLDPLKPLSARIHTNYCLAVFSGKRTLYGIQNWRHVNCGVLVDPKIWILYNNLLATCCCARNQLTVKPSLLKNLVRSYYRTGLVEGDHSFSLALNELDTDYFDYPLNDLIIPSPTRKDEREINLISVLVEIMDDKQLLSLASSMSLEVVEQKRKFRHVSNMERNDGLIELDSTSPWSKDVLREFMQSFLHNAYDESGALEELAMWIGTLIMQVIERVALQDIKASFETFLKVSAEIEKSNGSEECQTILFRRKFLRALYDTYFKECLDSAEFPGDLLGRVDWFGFQEKEREFRLYNQVNLELLETDMIYTGDPDGSIPFQNPECLASEEGKKTISRIRSYIDEASFNALAMDENEIDDAYMEMLISVEERVLLATKLQTAHQKTIESFTETLPKGPDGDIAKQLKSYLSNQILKLLEVRRIHNIVETGFTDEAFESLIHVLDGHVTLNGDGKNDEGDTLKKIFSVDMSTKSLDKKVDEAHYYKGIDFVKRVNEETYKTHCNYAFFEVIKHLVPQERHLVDFIGKDLYDTVLGMKQQSDILQIARDITSLVYDNLILGGYLKKDFRPNMDEIMSLMMKHLNFFLDAAFWVVFNVFEKDQDTYTKVSYAHLQSEEARFNLLMEVTNLAPLAHMVHMSSAHMLKYETRMRLTLMRATGQETMAPLISGYDYIDMRKHLEEDAWDMIRATTFRMCPYCGRQPCNPLVCLLCGSIVCHHGACCERNKSARTTQMMEAMEREEARFMLHDVLSVYMDELVAHTYTCGGGQCVYLSPYNSYIVFMDQHRHCVTTTLYADNYGNRDLHRKVYGNMTISQTRLTNVTNALCQGKLTHEIISIHKDALV